MGRKSDGVRRNIFMPVALLICLVLMLTTGTVKRASGHTSGTSQPVLLSAHSPRPAATVAPTAPTATVAAPTPTSAPTKVVPLPMNLFAPFDIGGYKLFLYCGGSGSPTVIMDGGLGDASGTWNNVYPQLTRYTRVCMYDRAGIGRSTPGPAPRTSAHMVEELHALLDKAGIGGPYVLVGHSFGGLNMRLFAHEYPAGVVGLVEVEALPDINFNEIKGRMSQQELAELNIFLHWNLEGVDVQTSLNQARAIGSLGALPMVVLARGRPDPAALGISPAHAAEGEQFWREWEQELLHLSSQSTLIIATNSGHYVQNDEPELVVTAIRELITPE